MAELSDREKIAHLLRRFAFGVSESELDFYSAKGFEGAIEALLDYEKVDPQFDLTAEELALDGRPKMRDIQALWMIRMCLTRRPLEEKLTLFWHNHFATAYMKVDVPSAMQAQNELLRANALGSFHKLLIEVSKDPAMLYWLDNQFNVKGKPNENFAREIMELFTLGVGHYSEKDVQEGARAFTGWTYGVGRRLTDKPRGVASFQFRKELHDDGVKTFLGNKGPFDGEDICGMLVGRPECSRFIAKKMWEWFAYPEPDDALVDRIATNFRSHGLSIRQMVSDIMHAPEFYSPKCVRRLYKNPVDFCVSTYRQFGIGTMMREALDRLANEEDAKKKQAGRAIFVAPLLEATKSMGMEILNPPDVSGWKPGSGWISSATMIKRIQWADTMLRRIPIEQVLAGEADSVAKARRLCSLVDADLPNAKVAKIADAIDEAGGSSLRPTAVRAAAVAGCRLIFAAPEFQMC